MRRSRILINEVVVPTEEEYEIANWIFTVQDQLKWRKFVDRPIILINKAVLKT